MSKSYWIKFGGGDSRPYTGLTPTFVIFNTQGGTALISPPVAEAGIGTGFYTFTYGTTQPISFLADGGSALSATDRYVPGVLDPIQAVDQQVGYVTDSFGSTLIDPTTIFGYVRRIQELFEGDGIFSKATAIWQIFSRGSSTLLRTKSLTNNTTSAGKTGV